MTPTYSNHLDVIYFWKFGGLNIKRSKTLESSIWHSVSLKFHNRYFKNDSIE